MPCHGMPSTVTRGTFSGGLPPPDPPIPVSLRPSACGGPEARSSRAAGATDKRLPKRQRSKAKKQSKEAKQSSKPKKQTKEAKQSILEFAPSRGSWEGLRWIPLEKIV